MAKVLGNIPKTPVVDMTRMDATDGARPKLNDHLKATGVATGAPKLQNDKAAAPPKPAANAQAIVSRFGEPKIVITDKTTLQQIASKFGKAEFAGKHLRLYEENGVQVLHLHNPDKKSNLFNGAERRQKHEKAMDVIKGLIDKQVGVPGKGSEALNGIVTSRTKIDTAQLKDIGKAATALRDDADKQHWETDYGTKRDGSLQKVEGWMKGAVSGLVHFDAETRASERAAFSDGDVHVDRDSKVAISANGGGGVLFATETGVDGSKTGVAIKIEDPALLKMADFVSDVAEGVMANLDRPLPFTLPKHELLQVDKGSANYKQLDAALTEMAQSTNDRDQTKATEYKKALDNGGLASKYEFMEGEQLNKLDTADKIATIKSGWLPNQLGASMPAVMGLGLDDHLSSVGHDGQANLANLFLKEDGQLAMIDFSSRMSSTGLQGELGPPYGVSDQGLINSFKGLVDYLKLAAASTDPKGFVDAQAQAAKHSILNDDKHVANPFHKILYAMLTPGDPGAGALFDKNTEKGAPSVLLGESERRNMVLDLTAGLMDGLVHMRDNAEAFATGHKGTEDSKIADPDQTFGQIKQMLQDADIGSLAKTISTKYGPLVTDNAERSHFN